MTGSNFGTGCSIWLRGVAAQGVQALSVRSGSVQTALTSSTLSTCSRSCCFIAGGIQVAKLLRHGSEQACGPWLEKETSWQAYFMVGQASCIPRLSLNSCPRAEEESLQGRRQNLLLNFVGCSSIWRGGMSKKAAKPLALGRH